MTPPPKHTSELLDHLVVIPHALLDNHLRTIHLPTPLSPYRVGVVPDNTDDNSDNKNKSDDNKKAMIL